MAPNPDTPPELRRHRSRINNINEVIVEKIAARMEQVENVKEVKEEAGLPVADGDREEKVRTQFRDLFERNDLGREHGEELADLLIEIAKEEQRS